MSDVTYFWDEYSLAWDNDPDYMVDGFLTNYASTDADGALQLLYSTTGSGSDLGTITKVELRIYGHGDGTDEIELNFASPASTIHTIVMPTSPGWSAYKDVTDDSTVNGWTWAKVSDLNGVQGDYLRVVYDSVQKANMIYCAKVEVRVTYTPTAEGVTRSYGFIFG